VLAAVFIVAAAAKLADRAGSRQAVEAFGVPDPLAGLVAVLLPWAELAAGTLLLITATSLVGAGLAAALLGLFCAGITRSIIRGEAPDCHCFGQLHSEPAGPRTLARNALLAGLAILVLVGGSGTSATAWIARLPSAGLAGLIGGVVAAGVLAGGMAAFLSLLGRYGQLLLRIDRLEDALAERGIVVPEPAPPPVGISPGSPAPELGIPDLDGQPVTLEELTAEGRPLVLTFTDPGCGPCSALLPQIAIWQREHADKLRIVLVSRGDREANLAHAREHGVTDVLLQSDHEVTTRYQVNGTPSAVLVSPDGTIDSWVHGGAEAVTALVVGQLPPPVLQVQHAGPSVGHPAPDLTLTTLEGPEARLSEQLQGRTAVLFWNPTCGFCQRMLPDLQRFAESPPGDAPSIVVVSTGELQQNRDMGLRSPVLLDGAFATASAFGATGTPSAVLVDEEGRVASGIAVGAPAVLELMGA
jgi:methylamine dehydrogenase accessory protein MauD